MFTIPGLVRKDKLGETTLELSFFLLELQIFLKMINI